MSIVDFGCLTSPCGVGGWLAKAAYRCPQGSCKSRYAGELSTTKESLEPCDFRLATITLLLVLVLVIG